MALGHGRADVEKKGGWVEMNEIDKHSRWDIEPEKEMIERHLYVYCNSSSGYISSEHQLNWIKQLKIYRRAQEGGLSVCASSSLSCDIDEVPLDGGGLIKNPAEGKWMVDGQAA